MQFRFSKENMYTGAGFLTDSLQTDLGDFQAVAPEEFDAAFVASLAAARAKVKTATGAALRTGSAAQVTARLYANMDKVKPLLDRLDIRLGFVPKEALTVAPSKFGLKTLRDRLAHRDAEAASRALTVLEQAIADNFTALKGKGYTQAEQAELTSLHGLINEDNQLQNKDLNTNTTATTVEDADYKTLDNLLGKVIRTGRLLYKADKKHRRQYEAPAILKRMQADEHPKADAPQPKQ